LYFGSRILILEDSFMYLVFAEILFL